MVQAAYIAHWFFNILRGALILRILLSWIPHNPDNPFIRLLYEVTDPLLAPFRRLIPRSSIPIDLSPILAFFVLDLIRNFVINALLRM